MAEIVTMPKLGFDMAEGTLVRWVVAEGAAIAKDALIAEIETDKATVEVESPYAGIVLKHLVGEDAIVPINDPIAVIGVEGEEVDFSALMGDSGAEAAPTDTGAALETVAPTPVSAEPAAEGAKLPEGVRASPLARRMAKDKGISLAQVSGSGPKGRIIKRDIEAYRAAPAATATPTFTAPPSYATAAPEDTTVPLTRLRKAIARRMTESKQYLPHFYVTYEYNLDPLMALRKQINATLAESGEKVSVNDFMLKAVALCLREYPNLNASLGDGELIRHGHINVGVAVAVEGGLLTIAPKDTDQKSIRHIAQEVRAMAGRARSGKVHPDDIQGSTFTVSNLGMYGVDDFIAIINPPEVAILSVSAAKKVPVVTANGELGIGWRMKATISADHRVTDGAEAAEFMRALAKYLEEPFRLLL